MATLDGDDLNAIAALLAAGVNVTQIIGETSAAEGLAQAGIDYGGGVFTIADVAGRILGGGAATIVGPGVWAYNSAGSVIPPATMSGAIRIGKDGTATYYAAGSNTDAARGTAILAAQTAASAGDLIIVSADAYVTGLGKNGVNWLFRNKCRIYTDISGSFDAIWRDGGSALEFRVDGDARFEASESQVAAFTGLSTVSMSYTYARNTGYAVPCVYGKNPGLKLSIRGDEIYAADYDALWFDDIAEFDGHFRLAHAGDNVLEGYAGHVRLTADLISGGSPGGIENGAGGMGPLSLWGGKYVINANEIRTQCGNVYQLTITASSGNYTINVATNGETKTTGNIAYNANAATIQAALRAVGWGLGSNTNTAFVVTGTGPWRISVNSVLSEAVVTVNQGTLAGGTAAIAQYDASNFAVYIEQEDLAACEAVINCPKIIGPIRHISGSLKLGPAVLDTTAWSTSSVTVGDTGVEMNSVKVSTRTTETNSFTAASNATVKCGGDIQHNKALNNVELSLLPPMSDVKRIVQSRSA